MVEGGVNMKYVVDLKDGFIPYSTADGCVFPGNPNIDIFDGKYFSAEDVTRMVDNARKNVGTCVKKETADEFRNEGRFEAWELVISLVKAESEGGFSDRDLKAMFGTEDPWEVICNHSCQEVSDAIKEYQLPKIGDLVAVPTDGGKQTGIVVGCDNGEYSVLFADGGAEYYLPDEFEKTGEHSDIMCSLLNALKGE
jgi:hypothetical protein